MLDKNKLLLTHFSKKRVNKTPSKIIFPNRTNLTFANIIVNMNSTPSFNNIDSWNNSYFNTELYNNSFYNKSKNSISDISRNISETRDDQSEILSLLINGILSLKSNDFLTYSTKLIEIITYIRDNREKYNYIDINSEMNKDLLMIIYQIFFQLFPENSFINSLIKNDLKNETKIFKKIHSIYILYILTALSYLHNNNIKSKNIKFYAFLKKFLKKEKCIDKKCPICINAENYEKNNFNSFNKNQNQISINQKPSIIKLVDKRYKKNNNINKKIVNSARLNNINKNIANNSNDNILYKKLFYNQDNESNYYSNRIKKTKINEIKKKLFNSQIVNLNEKEKFKESNYSLTKNKKSNNNIVYKTKNIYTKENKINNFEIIEVKKYDTEINQNDNNKLKKMSGENFCNINEIKKKLTKNKNKSSKKSKPKLIDINDNPIINDKKINYINKTNKNQLSKHKTIKLKILNNTKIKSEKKLYINLDDFDKKNNNINNNIITEKKINNQEINPDINNSSKIIKENINLIQKEIDNFKEHNAHIKQELEKIFNKSKIYK